MAAKNGLRLSLNTAPLMVSVSEGEDTSPIDSISFVSQTNKLAEPSRPFSGVRYRDPTSWIKKFDDDRRPPSSPIVSEASCRPLIEEGKVKQIAQVFSNRAASSQHEETKEISKVKSLTGVFDSKNTIKFKNEPPKKLVSQSSSQEEGRVKELINALSVVARPLPSLDIQTPAKSVISKAKQISPRHEQGRRILFESSAFAEKVSSAEKREADQVASKVENDSRPQPVNEGSMKEVQSAADFPVVVTRKRQGAITRRSSAHRMDQYKLLQSPLLSTGEQYEQQPNALEISNIIDPNEPQSEMNQQSEAAGSEFSASPISSVAEDAVDNDSLTFEPLMEEIDTLELEGVAEDETKTSNDDMIVSSLLLSGSFRELIPRRMRSQAIAGEAFRPEASVHDQLMWQKGDLDKSWREFYKAVLEVVTSEHTFVSKWHIANSLFINPLLERLGEERTLRLVPLTCWYNIFRFHEALLSELMMTLAELWGEDFARFDHHSVSLELNELIVKSKANLAIFSSKLQVLDIREPRLCKEQVKNWFVRLNTVVMQHANALIIAREFIMHYPTAVAYLDAMSAKKKAFIAELENCPDLERLRFRDFLIQPVQNVCRYHLLYKTIVDKAPSEELKMAASPTHEKLAAITQRVNESMKNGERKSAEALMARLKSHNNHKHIGRLLLLPKAFPLPKKHSSLSVGAVKDDFDLGLHDVTSVPVREGDIQIIGIASSIVEGEEAKANRQQLVENLVGRGKIKALLCMNQLLLIESHFLWSTPSVFHSFRFFHDWQRIKVEEDTDRTSVVHLIFQSDAGDVDIAFEVEDKQGWLRDLKEVCKSVEGVRQREQIAQLQMSKRRSLPSLQVEGLSFGESDSCPSMSPQPSPQGSPK